MLDRFRKSLKPKKGMEPADVTPHASPRPGETCHACGRPMPAAAELPPSPPMTASPASSVGDDEYYFVDEARQNGEAWSSLNKNNKNINNNNYYNSNHGGRNNYSSHSNYSGRINHSSHSNYSGHNNYNTHNNYNGHNNYGSQPNSNINSPASNPEATFGLQFRPPVRQGTWSSSIYSPQTPDGGNAKDAGWYRRGSVTRAGHGRPMGTPISTVDEDSEYSFDLPKRTLSNYSQSRRRTISSMFRHRDSTPSEKSQGRMSVPSVKSWGRRRLDALCPGDSLTFGIFIIMAKDKTSFSLGNTASSIFKGWTVTGVFECSFLYFLPSLALIFYSLCLTGCVTDIARTPDLFVISLAENVNTANEITIQIGYFGMCLRAPSASPICKPTVALAADQLSAAFLPSPLGELTNSTVAPILQAARALQADAILAPFAVPATVLLVMTTALSLCCRHVRHRELLRRVLVYLVWLSAAAAVVSSVATTQTGAALAYATRGIHGLTASPTSPGSDDAVSAAAAAGMPTSRIVRRGLALEGLQWAAAAFQVLIAGYTVLVVSRSSRAHEDEPRRAPAPVISRPRPASSWYSQV
ncbi:hypothetical protein MAPG_05038 [Magnaporthiopsis poae ATCC 64411]|uniref:Uncharacterized protein n=1 Tax=Magnaporthiopsis poae (strain ATCC 64411 / 73-15) TaxID=644358 RepID=A0A0C4DYC0_MAGP6|nr:hypothetical protein MAPG_05038 [Magnaporthiopsis poae ATCC 64411]